MIGIGIGSEIEPRHRVLAMTLPECSDAAHTPRRVPEPTPLVSKVRVCGRGAPRRAVIDLERIQIKMTSDVQVVTDHSVGFAIASAEDPTMDHLVTQDKNSVQLGCLRFMYIPLALTWLVIIDWES